MIEFFDIYDLKKVDITKRYQTKASQFYRRRLATQAQGNDFKEDQPTMEEGRVCADGTQIISYEKESYYEIVDKEVEKE